MNKEKIKLLLGSEPVQTIAQLVLGGIFIYAALGKIFYPTDFAVTVQNYKLLPQFLVKVTTYALPWIEFIFGTMLVLNVKKRISALILSSLLVVFILAILISLIRGIDINCGCFFQTLNRPESSKTGPVLLIVRDIFLLVPGLIILFFLPPDRAGDH